MGKCIGCCLARQPCCHRWPFRLLYFLYVGIEQPPHFFALGFWQRIGKLCHVADCLGFIADSSFGCVVILPNGDHDKGENHGIENADNREFESSYSLLSFNRSIPHFRLASSINPTLYSSNTASRPTIRIHKGMVFKARSRGMHRVSARRYECPAKT